MKNNIFIEKAILKHGNKYDYSKVEYVNSKEKVIIICKEHGEFKQNPNNHLNGQGCIKCKHDNQKLTQNNFINIAKIKHNNKYDYSLVQYKNAHTKISIICKEHGVFNQTPHNHINLNQGCIKCANDNKRLNKNEFIEKCKLKNGDKYDYHLVDYKSTSKKVKIICKIHGIFTQCANSHLRGCGCPKCCLTSKIDVDEFIKRAKLKHNDKYDYSRVEYIGSNKNIIIICKIHGEFKQRPDNHIMGNGCPKCGSFYGIKENKWIDSLNISNIKKQVKIGKYIVDGYDPSTNTIYEFNGNYWHGNPNKYNLDDINLSCKKTFRYLYEKTIEKENTLRELGYNYISIWENDFK